MPTNNFVFIEEATKKDATDLAHLINIAGEGMPHFMWQSIADQKGRGETALDIGTARARREKGDFSYRNACVVRGENRLRAGVISGPLPAPYDIGNLDDFPACIRPLILLKSKAPGSWFINFLAVYESDRRQRLASALLADTLRRAAFAARPYASLIVHSTSAPALAFFQDFGFSPKAAHPTVTIPGVISGGTWQLMVKSVF